MTDPRREWIEEQADKMLLSTCLPVAKIKQILGDAWAKGKAEGEAKVVADANRAGIVCVKCAELQNEMDRMIAVGEQVCKSEKMYRDLLEEREVLYRRTQDANIQLKAELAAIKAEAQHRGKPVNEQLTQAGKDLRLIRSLHTTGTDDHPTPAKAHPGGGEEDDDAKVS